MLVREFPYAYDLLFPGTSVSAPVLVIQMRHLVKDDLRLIFHNAELADPVVYMDLGISERVGRPKPLVVVPAVRTVDHTLMVGLDDPVIFEG